MYDSLSNVRVALDQAVVASYLSHVEAEKAVHRLASHGVPLKTISMIGKNYETTEGVEGLYHPADAVRSGVKQGAWVGGIFGLMLGIGLFVFPTVGALVVLGPLAGMLAGTVGGAGAGALINGLLAAGIPRDQAVKYQERLQAGESLVTVHGHATQTAIAVDVLRGTPVVHLQIHGVATGATAMDSLIETPPGPISLRG